MQQYKTQKNAKFATFVATILSGEICINPNQSLYGETMVETLNRVDIMGYPAESVPE